MLDDDKHNNNIRIIYLSTVPDAAKEDRGPIYLTKALSKIALKAMSDLGIETLDLMPMLYSVNERTVDYIHYLKVEPPTGKVHGEFGPRVADAIINYICS